MTLAGILILTAGGLTALVCFPLAVLDNPQRRRKQVRRSS